MESIGYGLRIMFGCALALIVALAVLAIWGWMR